MHNELIITLSLAAGVVLQSFLFLVRKASLKDYVIAGQCLILSTLVVVLFIALGMKGFGTLEPHWYVAIGGLLYAASFALVLKDRVLPEIDEIVVMTYLVVVWYLVLTHWSLTEPLYYPLILISAFLLWVCISTVQLRWRGRTLVYVAFMCMSLAIAGVLAPRFLYTLSNGIVEASPGVMAESVLLGMFFLYVFATALYLFYFLPVTTSKDQSWTERKWEIINHAFVVGENYNSKQYHYLAATSAIAFSILLLATNYYLNIVSESFTIGAVLVVAPAVAEALHRGLNSRQIEIRDVL